MHQSILKTNQKPHYFLFDYRSLALFPFFINFRVLKSNTMIKLQHKTSLEFITLTGEEYLKLSNLKEYDPVDAEDVVTVYKSSPKGEI